MSTWVIGDVHGAYYTLMALLERLALTSSDHVVYLGDYVNKGRYSLQVLRFLAHSKSTCIIGNNELAWLYAMDQQVGLPCMAGFNGADDRDELACWMRSLPWAYKDDVNKAVMVHAGVDPAWSVDVIMRVAGESAALISNPEFIRLLREKKLSDVYVRNAWILTHIRFLSHDGSLSDNTGLPPQPKLTPWFDCLPHQRGDYRIYFGHWARLEGRFQSESFCNLDGGVAYGKQLVACHLESRKIFRQSADMRDFYE